MHNLRTRKSHRATLSLSDTPTHPTLRPDEKEGQSRDRES